MTRQELIQAINETGRPNLADEVQRQLEETAAAAAGLDALNTARIAELEAAVAPPITTIVRPTPADSAPAVVASPLVGQIPGASDVIPVAPPAEPAKEQ